MVDLIQEHLKEINGNRKIRPYLRNYPFTLENLEFSIFIFHPDGSFPPLNHINYISAHNGVLKYELTEPSLKEDSILLKQETLEEALEILKEESE